MDFDKSQTKTNLARAFAGECQGGARYQFIAQKALAEDKKNIETIMKSLAKNEMAHAKIYWDLIAKYSGSPQKNIEIKAGYPFEDADLIELIKFASKNEKSENSSIYPSFAKIAEDEGFEEIAEKFKMIALVENDHFMVLDEIYNKLKSKELYKNAIETMWVCDSCGYTFYGKQCYDVCPLCGKTHDYVNLNNIINAKK